MKFIKPLLVFAFLSLSFSAFAQMDDEAIADSMLTQVVENVNRVYKPVIGVGVGVMNFYGEVHDKVRSPLAGTPAFKVNIATFIDKKHYFRGNFFLLVGSLTGNERSSDTARNLNFKSDITSFGLNIHYDFKHLFKESPVRPFVSVGLENIQFNSKTDLYDAKGQRYHYWKDGTIHNIPEMSVFTNDVYNNSLIKRDYTYETDLRGNQSYSQSSLAIPVDVGIDFKISERLNLRVGNSWHFTFTDNIDNVSPQSPGVKGDKKKDIFTYSYFSLHFDLFTAPKTIKINNMFKDLGDYDLAMYDDEDNDMVRDLFDQCPGTPFGVKVDSVGCPLDGDKDGVPDYKDKELNTPADAMVDDDGVQIKAEDYAEKLNIQAINRRELEAFLMAQKALNKMRQRSAKALPPKFKSLDIDGDGYLSFEELIKAINDYFDFSNDLTTKDIYELQDFFFEQ
ncbi:MAG: DUF6089 family protein [Bacteroidota bacterium]|nr:DUF6089 family protein [Bacteroidota bacterium]